MSVDEVGQYEELHRRMLETQKAALEERKRSWKDRFSGDDR